MWLLRPASGSRSQGRNVGRGRDVRRPDRHLGRRDGRSLLQERPVMNDIKILVLDRSEDLAERVRAIASEVNPDAEIVSCTKIGSASHVNPS